MQACSVLHKCVKSVIKLFLAKGKVAGVVIIAKIEVVKDIKKGHFPTVQVLKRFTKSFRSHCLEI